MLTYDAAIDVLVDRALGKSEYKLDRRGFVQQYRRTFLTLAVANYVVGKATGDQTLQQEAWEQLHISDKAGIILNGG